MTVAHCDLALQIIGKPVRHFRRYEEALQSIADYRTSMVESAARKWSMGLTVTDQDQPEEVFCLFPARCYRPPLAIIGGMGPMAGAFAFEKACAQFKNSRAIVLYQACTIPDRSEVILKKDGPNALSVHEVGARLAEAVRLAANIVSSDGQPVRCMLACNSAHYFLQSTIDNLHNTATQVQMLSLVKASIEAPELRFSKRALLLTTEGARAGMVFSAPCREAGIGFDELSSALSSLLMKTIYEGVKSMDGRRAAELGNELFESILQCGCSYDCLLAGCTELPLTIELLKARGSPNVAAYLSQVKIVDPLEEVLRYV